MGNPSYNSSFYEAVLERGGHLSKMQIIVLNIDLEREVVTCLNHVLYFVTGITVSIY